MKTRSKGLFVLLSVVAGTSFGSGFALYEPSAVSHAMGGALVGKAMDASANYNNPATLTDLTNLQFTVGFVTEHPRAHVYGNKYGSSRQEYSMDPNFFVLPHFMLAAPLPAGFTFGLGFSAEYGLGSKYDNDWLMNWNARETTIQGLVLNPNIAYKITDDWSVAVGLRWLYFDFEQYSNPQVPYTLNASDLPAAYQGYAGTYELGRFNNHLKGDNKLKSLGWQIGTKYDITKTFSVGVVYKSAIDVGVHGKTQNSVSQYNDANIATLAKLQGLQKLQSDVMNGRKTPADAAKPSVQQKYISSADQVIRETVSKQALSHTGSAKADITLPQSVTFGANWDVLPTWHLGSAVSWTEWSEFSGIHFQLTGGDRYTQLDWRDTWRASIGSCWDFWEDWKWMVSYTYDMDSTRSDQNSVMLPAADRHILATGFAWNCWGGLELALSYSCIFMDGGDINLVDDLNNRYNVKTKWGFCHAAGFSITYRF